MEILKFNPHENIVRAFDVFYEPKPEEQEFKTYIVMELGNKNLKQYTMERGQQ